MNATKKLILGTVCGTFLFAAAEARAANEVIYKIHDVNPISEGSDVTGCDFSITLFNRASQIVSNLSVDLSWKDEVIENQINEEKVEKPKNAAEMNNNRRTPGDSKTEEFTSKTVSANFNIPPIQPNKQISLKGNVKTDRCFLLMQEPELIVRSCKFGAGNTDTNAGLCKRMFKYISPEDAEYYTDFQAISYSEQRKEDQQLSQDEQKDLDRIYRNALSSVKRISETLNSMN